MPIVYSLISRGPTVLCSCQQGDGDFTNVSHSILPNIPVQNDAKTTYTANSFTFHVIVENGLIFLCAATTDCTRTQSFGFLDDIKSKFQNSALVQRAQFANSDEFDRDFQQVLSQQMEKYSDPQSTQLGQLQSQVSEVKGIMVQNIDKVLERGENLDTLMQTTEDLEAHSTTFHKTTRSVRRKYWWKNLKMKIILVAVVLIILLVVILIILFSAGVLPVKSDDKHKTAATTPAAYV